MGGFWQQTSLNQKKKKRKKIGYFFYKNIKPVLICSWDAFVKYPVERNLFYNNFIFEQYYLFHLLPYSYFTNY